MNLDSAAIAAYKIATETLTALSDLETDSDREAFTQYADAKLNTLGEQPELSLDFVKRFNLIVAAQKDFDNFVANLAEKRNLMSLKKRLEDTAKAVGVVAESHFPDGRLHSCIDAGCSDCGCAKKRERDEMDAGLNEIFRISEEVMKKK